MWSPFHNYTDYEVDPFAILDLIKEIFVSRAKSALSKAWNIYGYTNELVIRDNCTSTLVGGLETIVRKKWLPSFERNMSWAGVDIPEEMITDRKKAYEWLDIQGSEPTTDILSKTNMAFSTALNNYQRILESVE